MDQRLSISGMHCAACANTIEGALKKTKGVHSASVSFASEEADVTFDTSLASVDDLITAVKNVGYDASALGSGAKPPSPQDLSSLKTKTVTGLVLSSLTMAVGMSFHSSSAANWVQLLLALPVQFWCGFGFLQGMVKAALRGQSNMDTLVGLGTLSAFLFSVFVTLSGSGHVYFEISAFLVSFILLGKWLETRAKYRTGEAIRKLMDLVPPTARVLRMGVEKEIPVKDVFAGDILVIRPGDKIPVDGELTQGSSSIDESMLTGESIPIEKVLGSAVIAGTINKSGHFQMRAKRIGNKTVLAQIVELVKRAQASKAPIQKYADLVASYFVPTVLILSVITFVVWFLISHEISTSLLQAVSVLIIACPCALGLATPAAVIVGMGKATEKGILIRNAQALELLHQAKTIVFDKTGTLTQGEPILTDFISAVEKDETHVLTLIASAEAASEHLLAQAVVSAAKSRGLSLLAVETFKAFAGQGIEARIKGETVLVGTASFLKSRGFRIYELEVKGELLAQSGKSVFFAAIGSQAVATLAIMDPPRTEANEAISKLKSLGLEVIMITGDRKPTANAVAKTIGIENVLSEVLPQQKEVEVRMLQNHGAVIMVGDGVNDAPALAAADIGIAIGTGTDVAIEAADVTLLRGDLRSVPEAILLSRKTMRTIKQNLFASFFYNTMGIPVAAGLLVPLTGWRMSPMLAGAAMAMSSVSVILNSLRLKAWKWN